MEGRLEKMEHIKEKALDPYCKRFERLATAEELKKEWDQYTKEELAEKENESITASAGRIMTKRGKGKAGFAHMQDISGQIQIYVRKDQIGEEASELWYQADLGYFVVFTGPMLNTNTE